MTMRTLLLSLALAAPLVLAGCQSDQAEAIEEQGEALNDAYDEQGDAIEEAYDDQAEIVDEQIEDGAPMGDREDVIGDGEIIDEPGEPDAGVLGQ